MPNLSHGPAPRALLRAARTAVGSCLKTAPGERALIVTNPGLEVRAIAEALYAACVEAQGIPSLICQPRKSQLDFGEPSVYAALATRPAVFMAVTEDKIGRDRQGARAPYEAGGRKYDNLLRYLLYGERCLRAFWSPAITRRIFARTVPIDYALLKSRCNRLKPVLDAATTIRLESPAGTQLSLGVQGRSSRADDGDFGQPGSGGNLPAGEVFLSPQPGTASGRLVFDGSLATTAGALRVRRPMSVELREGFIAEIRGDKEAEALQESLRRAETQAREMEHEGSLAQGLGEIYARNARALGELGIGLNPRARIEGNLLNDEKVYGTCHLAVGFNLDEDAPALIHLDGLVRRPTLTAVLPGGEQTVLMQEGLFSET
jgi:aminopeptidase